MSLSPTRILCFYGIFLIGCGIASVLLIGPRAKTALASGGLSGVSAIGTAWLLSAGVSVAYWVAVALPSALFLVFSWRVAKTLFSIFDLIPAKAPELNGKGIAFLMIGLMAVMSLVTAMLLIVSHG